MAYSRVYIPGQPHGGSRLGIGDREMRKIKSLASGELGAGEGKEYIPRQLCLSGSWVLAISCTGWQGSHGVSREYMQTAGAQTYTCLRALGSGGECLPKGGIFRVGDTRGVA